MLITTWSKIQAGKYNTYKKIKLNLYENDIIYVYSIAICMRHLL